MHIEILQSSSFLLLIAAENDSTLLGPTNALFELSVLYSRHRRVRQSKQVAFAVACIEL